MHVNGIVVDNPATLDIHSNSHNTHIRERDAEQSESRTKQLHKMHAFVAAPLHARRGIRQVHLRRKTTCAQATEGLSQSAKTLVQRQIQNPIFAPSTIPQPLCDELSKLQSEQPPSFYTPLDTSAAARGADAIHAEHEEAIAHARARVLIAFPGIDGPGGALYPEHRADACWRDLREFARVVGYFCVAGKGWSDGGFGVMKELYGEMGVPVDAVVLGVQSMKEFYRGRVGDEVGEVVETAFDGLLAHLTQF